MKKHHLLTLFTAALMGSAALAQPAGAPEAQPQVHIAVGAFSCNARSCDRAFGEGLADALTNALSSSEYFAVYERQQLGVALTENMFAGRDAGAEVLPADVLIFGTVNALDVDASTGQGCFIVICVGSKESRIATTLRIVDARTGRIIATTQVEGRSSSNSQSFSFGGISLGGSQNQGLDKAVNAMLASAVEQLLGRIPRNYYRQ